MKLPISILLLIINLYSSDWEVQFPSPTHLDLNSTYFLSEDLGFVVGDGGTLAKTVDGGYSWENIELDTDNGIRDIIFYNNDIGFICGDQGLFYLTADGGSNWQSISTGIDKNLRKICIDGNILWCCGEGMSLFSYDITTGNLVDKSLENAPDGYNSTLIYFKGDLGFLSANSGEPNLDGKLLRSVDGGETWYETDISWGYGIGQPTEINAVNDTTLYLSIADNQYDVSYGFLYKSTNSGVDFEKVDGSIMIDTPLVDIHFFDEDRGYALKSPYHFESGYINKGDKDMWEAAILYTEDGGETWEEIYYNDEEPLFYFKELHFFNSQLGYATILDAPGVINLYQSLDGGMSWSKIMTDNFAIDGRAKFSISNNKLSLFPAIRDGNSYQITIDEDNIDFKFVIAEDDEWCSGISYIEETIMIVLHDGFSGNFDLVKSDNGGNNWGVIDIPKVRLTFPLIDLGSPETGWVTSKNQLFKTTTGGGVDIEENISVATNNLISNYPNPFNPTTTIKYSIEKSSVVEIIIFNYKGEIISSLVNKYQRKGDYSIPFNGSSFSSGIYFYQFRVDGKTIGSNKMILLK